MKKTILAVLSATFLLGGCATNEAQKAAEGFIEEAKQMESATEDNKLISEELQIKLVENKNEMLVDVVKMLDLKNEIHLEDAKGYSKLFKELSRLQDYMKYTVSEVKMSGDKQKAEIIAKMEYVDLNKEFNKIVEESIDREIVKIYDFEELSGEKFMEEVVSELTAYTKTITEDNVKLKVVDNVKATVEKTGDNWEIIKADEEIIDAITLGMKKVTNSKLEEKIKEVKENMKFMKTEANFHLILEEVNKMFSDKNNNLNLENFLNSKDSLSKSLSEKVGSAVIVTDKPSTQQGIYYLSKSEGKLKVQVVVDGQEYYLLDEQK